MKAKRCPAFLGAILVLAVVAFWLDDAGAARRRKTARRAKQQTVKMTGLSPADGVVYKQLAEFVDVSAWTLDTTFSEAIEVLRNSVEPRLKVVVLWGKLQREALIDRDRPIYLDGISGIPLRSALELLLMSVSEPSVRLDYCVEYGMIIIGPKDFLRERKMVVRVYDVSELTMMSSGGDFTPRAGGNLGRNLGGLGTVGHLQQGNLSAEGVVELIKQTIEPDSWEQ